ncbi:MAG: RNA polymerase factor sigma-54 [Hyphomicrobiaceae bacterium]|nr:RNA polymerase factor sigma-54 [Hyphomicrobiaceae bacterium]
MALTPRLELRQAQSLTLTPQLMQSIRLLQLSHLELNAFVEAELLRNPLLDAAEPEDFTDRDLEVAPRGNEDLAEDLVERGEHIGAAADIASSMDTEVDNVFPEQVGQDSIRDSTRPPEIRGRATEDAPDLEQYVSSGISLADHLSGQINLLVTHPADRLIARSLIDSLDEAGYLTTDCAQLAEQLGTDPEDVEAVLDLAQTCEPAGVFARNVRECLMLQLRERDRLDPMMQALLDHLDLLASHELQRLMKEVRCSAEDLSDMLAELRELDPKPGLRFDGAPMQAIVPDVYVREAQDGGWSVELNSDVLPKVLVNRTYYARVSKQVRSPKEKEFLVDCLQTANWLTKSLDQRAQTILRVASEIVRMQDGFLVHGVTHLRPMTLKMVADAIDMHESTVSRVTANKFIATPRGLFEMKYFFTTGLSGSEGGEDHSAESVRHFIKQMVDAESATAILSDDTIAARMKADHGIEVARRTVTKYREAMNIPSSVIRRRQKRSLVGA